MPIQKLLQYHSYLLRFWQETGPPIHSANEWRFSLEDVQTGERKGFADLELLIVFLNEQANNFQSREKSK